jgi:hypothetical protein
VPRTTVTGAIPRERLPGKALKDACVAEGIAVTVAEAREGGARADLFFPRADRLRGTWVDNYCY